MADLTKAQREVFATIDDRILFGAIEAACMPMLGPTRPFIGREPIVAIDVKRFRAALAPPANGGAA